MIYLKRVAKEDMDRSLSVYDYFLKKVPQLHISCKTGINVGKVLPLVKKVYERSCQQFNDDELTMLFKEALRHKTALSSPNDHSCETCKTDCK